MRTVASGYHEANATASLRGSEGLEECVSMSSMSHRCAGARASLAEAAVDWPGCRCRETQSPLLTRSGMLMRYRSS